MTNGDYDRARAAVTDLQPRVKLGVAMNRAGLRVVRVNIDRAEPASLVSLVHDRLRDIPHEIRRVAVARLETGD